MTAAARIERVEQSAQIAEMLAELDAIAPIAMAMPYLRASVENEVHRGRSMLELAGKMAGIESTIRKSRKSDVA